MRCWGINNFLPEIPEGEDDFTIKNYQRILNELHNYPAHKQNGELIDSLMKKTFPHRRQVLVKDMIRLSELLQMYPTSSSQEQVSIFSVVALSKIKVEK